ncbi:MAG TPA: Gfo/Idh/MocA family oxidoreductase [Gemmatimonadales bacterium]|nr:Gfo/Idh/MocA family oxidoreductase [Gemmatimonadales bacterium]
MAADAGAGPSAHRWRGRRTEARGGILLDHGTHLIYQLLDVAGLPRRLQSWGGRLRHLRYDVEDTAQLLLEFDGRLATIFLTWAADRRETGFASPAAMAASNGPAGSCACWGGTGPSRWTSRPSSTRRITFAGSPGCFTNSATGLPHGDGTHPLEDIARVTRVLEAAYGAHANGCRVAV